MLIDYDDSDDYRDDDCNDDCNDDEMVDQTQEDCLQKAQRIHPGKRCTWEIKHLVLIQNQSWAKIPSQDKNQ